MKKSRYRRTRGEQTMTPDKYSGSFPLASLYGIEPPTPDEVRRGMGRLEEKLRAEFDERARRQAAQAERSAALREEVRAARPRRGRRESRPTAAVRRTKEAYQAAVSRTLATPSARSDSQRIFTACVGATVVPPYNWPWGWQAASGSPSLSVTPDEKGGTIWLSAWTDVNNSSSASAAGAVGIFFRPFTANGILKIWSNPALTFDWGTWCTLASAHSDRWIGFYVGEYDVSGGFVGAVIDQQTRLWSDDSWWNGTGQQSGGNNGFPISADFNVDDNHFYEIWVWCGVNVSADGLGVFSGSGAGADLYVAVPSITWEL